MSPFVQALIGAIVWALANVVYVDMKRKGVRGFGRIVAFWMGTPTTWFSFFFLRDGRVPRFEPPLDDEASLLREIRRDRQLRELSAPPTTADEGPGGSEAFPQD